MPSARRQRLLATLALAGACALLFAFFRPAEAPAADPYVFAMSVADDEGAVLASPVVVGEAGKTVEVHLLCEADPRLERMSLVLEPISSPDGALAYSYELSVTGQVAKARGTVRLERGAEQRISVKPDGQRGVTLALYAAPLRHPGVEQYLKSRRARLGRTAT